MPTNIANARRSILAPVGDLHNGSRQVSRPPRATALPEQKTAAPVRPAHQ
jgi:hypothetical protein